LPSSVPRAWTNRIRKRPRFAPTSRPRGTASSISTSRSGQSSRCRSAATATGTGSRRARRRERMRTLVAVTLGWMSLTIAAPASAVERGYAPVNGLQLYYEIHGSPAKDGVPLVLLHGGGSTIETSFGKLIPLVSKTRQVIAFEQQGHGHTADVDRPFSFEQSAEDAVALLRHLHLGKADFLGYSNGGHIALEIALRLPRPFAHSSSSRPSSAAMAPTRDSGRGSITRNSTRSDSTCGRRTSRPRRL